LGLKVLLLKILNNYAISNKYWHSDIPLKLAKAITQKVNDSWASGEMLSKGFFGYPGFIKYWFKEPHTETRYFNFTKVSARLF